MNRELLRFALFLGIGGVQFAFDTGMFVLLTHAGMAPLWANPATRFFAALLGFVLNGKLTFRQSRLTGKQAFRYVVLWVSLTLASTGIVAAIAYVADIRVVWLAKACIELLLAVISFVLMRRWVFDRGVEMG